MSKYELNKPLFRQIFSFLFVGGICYVVAIALLLFFVEIANIEVNLANLLSSFITIFVCYFLNAQFVFQGGRYSRKKEILIFFCFSLVGLILNVVLMYLMTTFLAIWYVASKTLITAFIAVFNFVARKKVVFQN